MTVPETYTAALAAGKASPDTWHPSRDWRAEEASRARRVVSDRSGASFGFIETPCWFICEQGAALEALRSDITALLAVWDRPYVTRVHFDADLEPLVEALRSRLSATTTLLAESPVGPSLAAAGAGDRA